MQIYADCFEFAEFNPGVPSTGDADGRIVVRVGGLDWDFQRIPIYSIL